MGKYTLEEWRKLSEKERIKHNTKIMQAADFDITKVEVCELDNNIWKTKSEITIYPHNQYRLKPIPAEPTQEQQFQELIKRKGFEVGKRVQYTNGAIHLISDLTNSIIKFSNENGEVWTYNCNDLYGLERLELLPEPTQEEITTKFVKDNNLKVGDKLKVVRKFEINHWRWNEDMDKYIGKTGEISEIRNRVVELEFEDGFYYFLPQSLEVVKYRQFEDGAEFEPYFDKGIFVRRKDMDSKSRVSWFDNEGASIDYGGYYFYEQLFDNYEIIKSITDETGEPFGVEI